MHPVLITLLVIVGAVLIWFLVTYNSFVAKRNQVRTALSGIDVSFKLRHDLIPNIVESVKGYMDHEKDVLGRLTELREKARGQSGVDGERMALEGELGSLLHGITVRAEAYPELKASDNFVHLQKTLTEVEAQLSASRRSYNSAVESLNNGIEMFPSSIVAGMMNLRPLEFFEASEAERKDIKIDFS